MLLFQNPRYSNKILIMKNFILIFSLIILASCSTDDDAGDVINNEFEQIISILPQEEWAVSNLFTDNSDHTADFQGFTFNFREDGSVEGQTDLYTEVGTWAYKSTSENGEQLVLQFSGTPPFDKISNDWMIVSASVSKIELVIEGDNEDTQLLVFSRL